MGVNDRYRSCPAVSHICSFTCPLSVETVLVKKAAPMVPSVWSEKESRTQRIASELLPANCSPNTAILADIIDMDSGPYDVLQKRGGREEKQGWVGGERVDAKEKEENKVTLFTCCN